MTKDKNSQVILSSYFSPSPSKSTKRRERADSHIDLTSDAEDETLSSHIDEPPIKKIKVVRSSQSQSQPSPSRAKSHRPNGIGSYTQSTLFSQTVPTHTRCVTPTQTGSIGYAQQWAFSSEPEPVDPVKEARKAELHEAFKKKFLINEGPSTNRPSTSGTSDTYDMEVIRESATPMSEDMDITMEGEDGSGKESDPGFRELMSVFSNPTSTTAKKGGKQTALTKGASKQASAPRKGKKPPPKIGPSGKPYTPLELQVLKLKEDNPGTILMIEIGYKLRFFGNDAKIASKELGIAAYTDRNFMVAFVPVERLHVHLKKLLGQGYRVGVVKQTETAALKKVSETRNAPFERKLTHLYTATTYVDDLDSVDELQSSSPPPFMCLVEESQGRNTGDVSIALITVCPSTGDVIWDDFEDSLMRTELETRLVHTRPVELLIPKLGISEQTAKLIKWFTRNSAAGDKARIENIEQLMSYSDAFSSISKFYTDKGRSTVASEAFRSGKLIAEIADFPKRVVIALAHAVRYLSEFGIADVLLETKFFNKFATRTHMLLAANTLANLDIYSNDTDSKVEGTLIHHMDKTQTKFGARLLKNWIGRPLVDKDALQERVNAVQELIESSSEKLRILRETLARLPDLARGLCRIHYGQCTPKELARLLIAFEKIGNAYNQAFRSPADVGLDSPILNGIIYALPRVKPALKEFIDAVQLDQASEGNKELMWRDPDRFPDFVEAAELLQAAEVDLKEELKAIRKQLWMPSLEWTSHLNDEYLIEVKRAKKPPIPDNWTLHSRTKVVERYYAATVIPKIKNRARCLELLQAESEKAYQDFLKEISSQCYGILRDVINKLAVADCLNSLARVSSNYGYIKPEFTDDDSLEIIEGLHPLVDPCISNSVTMGFGQPRSKIITGPNMGGKSCFVRMVALVVLMAQVGSYVPAASVRMGLHDSILTRMGASDDLAKGRSTFMVEMSETSDILHAASTRSLVILDELGRGTSTFDGMAIADGVLRQLVEHTRSKTLFITHYPLIASAIEQKYPSDIENIHMGYISDIRLGGRRDITFLYKVERGITTESFGIECARLADMPEFLLEAASEHAHTFQRTLERRIRQNKIIKALNLIQQSRQEEESFRLEAIAMELDRLAQSLSIST